MNTVFKVCLLSVGLLASMITQSPNVNAANSVTLGNHFYDTMSTSRLLKIVDKLLAEKHMEEAQKVVSLLAKRPDEQTQFDVARLRAHRLDAMRDAKFAIRTFSKMLAGTSPIRGRAAFELARLYRTDETLNKQHKVLETLLLAAKLGNTKAYAEIAFVYASSPGPERDLNKAYEFYEKAAQFRSAAPIVAFARLLQRTPDAATSSINPKAVVDKYYSKLVKEATGGYAAAAKELARLHIDGNLKPKSFTKARKWLRQAVSGGDIGALRDLALLEMNANGNKKTLNRSLAMLKSAADAGNRAAHTTLKQLQEKLANP